MYRRLAKACIGATVLFIGLITAGCISTGDIRTQVATAEMSNEEIVVSLLYVPRSVRFERYGNAPNPFIARQSAITPNEFLVFDAFLENRLSQKVIALDQIVLRYGGRSAPAEYPSSMRIYWRTQEIDDVLSGGYEEQRFYRAIDRDMVTRGEQNGLNETSLGLLVFRGNFPSAGEAQVTIPTVDLQSGETINHYIPVSFETITQDERRRSPLRRYR